MLADVIHPLVNYLYEVFVLRFDAWAVLGFLAQALFSARFLERSAGILGKPTAFGSRGGTSKTT